jgi:DNA-binding FrmR family transcriptional regulator
LLLPMNCPDSSAIRGLESFGFFWKGYVMFSRVEKKTILKRLHYVQGQLRGIEKMIVEDRPLNDIFAQLRAAEEGIHKAVHEVFAEQLKKRLAEILSQRLAACPGNCSDAERLRFTRQQFAELDLQGVIESLSWLAPKGTDRKSSKLSSK